MHPIFQNTSKFFASAFFLCTFLIHTLLMDALHNAPLMHPSIKKILIFFISVRSYAHSVDALRNALLLHPWKKVRCKNLIKIFDSWCTFTALMDSKCIKKIIKVIMMSNALFLCTFDASMYLKYIDIKYL